MRYSVSGANSAAIEPATGAVRNVLGADIPSGRVFWLRGLWWGSSSTYGDLLLYDATAGATVGSGTKKGAFPAILSGFPGAGRHEFPAPGIKFASGCVVALEASGEIAIGECGGCGFEE